MALCVGHPKNLTLQIELYQVPIGCTGPRAFHSAAYLAKMESVALIGGIACNEQGASTRHKLAVVLVNISTWAWSQYVLSDEIFLSSTTVLTLKDNQILYFGGYTNKATSTKPGENEKSSFWGKVTFTKASRSSPVEISWRGKATQFDAFACGNAVKVGEEILISCGTEPMWGILTSNLPQAQPCDLPSCSINLSQAPAGLLDKWIR